MSRQLTIDDKFIAKLKKGDEKSFHRLYAEFAPAMRMICLRYVKNETDAEDVFHEGFIKVYHGVTKLKDNSSFVGWMKRIFINTALDHYKKLKGEKTDCIDDVNESHIDLLEENEDELKVDLESLTEDNYDAIRKVDFSQEEMLGALEFIPEHFRVVFQLFVIDNYKHQEIADLLSINEKTSKTRLLRARGLLKRELYTLAIQKLNHGQAG